jgi:hypothetical protein
MLTIRDKQSCEYLQLTRVWDSETSQRIAITPSEVQMGPDRAHASDFGDCLVALIKAESKPADSIHRTYRPSDLFEFRGNCRHQHMTVPREPAPARPGTGVPSVCRFVPWRLCRWLELASPRGQRPIPRRSGTDRWEGGRCAALRRRRRAGSPAAQLRGAVDRVFWSVNRVLISIEVF